MTKLNKYAYCNVMIARNPCFCLFNKARRVGSTITFITLASLLSASNAEEIVQPKNPQSTNVLAETNKPNQDSIKVPSVKSLFSLKKKGLAAGEVFGGKVLEVNYTEPHPFTGDKEVESVLLGGKYGKINIWICTLQKKAPSYIEIGSEIFMRPQWGVEISIANRNGYEAGVIVEGNYVASDTNAEHEVKKKDVLIVDEYFLSGIEYGGLPIRRLTGSIQECNLGIDNFNITLYSDRGTIICFYDTRRWKNEPEIKQALKKLSTGDSVTLSGHFIIEHANSSMFDVSKMITTPYSNRKNKFEPVN